MLDLPVERTNAFGHRVPNFASLLEIPKAREVVWRTLNKIFIQLGQSEVESRQLTDRVISEARTSALEQYESNCHSFLRESGVLALIPQKLTDRSSTIFSQIKDYVPGNSKILDMGCGDGGVAQLLAVPGRQVVLCDVYEHPRIAETGLPFFLFAEGKRLPFEDADFDLVLLLTVFHHSNDPMVLLSESLRTLRPQGRLVVIESVFGVDRSKSLSLDPESQYFTALDSETQRISNIFFDHFYNRIVHFSGEPAKKVNVPFNFNTPQNWDEIFKGRGLKEVATIHLGIDQAIVPEYHTLHVFDKLAAA